MRQQICLQKEHAGRVRSLGEVSCTKDRLAGLPVNIPDRERGREPLYGEESSPLDQ